MERIASLFCHVTADLRGMETQTELQRQHNVLVRCAVHSGRTIEHCFFHVGEWNLAEPDPVLLRFFQCAQAGMLGLVFVERRELFPLPRQALVPQLEVYFVREGVRESFGRGDARVEEEKNQGTNSRIYWGV